MFYDKISTLVDNDFSNWLFEQMNLRAWSQADLSRASGLNRQVISNYINIRRTNPEPDALIAIANAFKISPITVFRKAGLLPEGGDQVSFEDWQHLIAQLTEEEQEEMREIITLKIERRKKQEGLKSLNPKKAG